jgi:hypothetical protein
LRNNEAMVARWHVKFALLLVTLVAASAAQNPKSVTFLRLSSQIVEQRLQAPAASEDWSAVLRKQYQKAGIQPDQLTEQAVPGSSQPMLICTLKGRGNTVILVTAGLEVPQTEAERSVAWASLAMLPLLAESLNSVSTDSSIVLIALPPVRHHASSSSSYAEKLGKPERAKIKAVVEISGVGRGATSYEVKQQERYLADWLVVAAASLRQDVPAKSEYFDSADFADAKAFRSAGVPAITVSSQPQHAAAAWNRPGLAVEVVYPNAFYDTYQALCVFVIDLDRAARGESPRSLVATSDAPPNSHAPAFTEDQASTMITRQIAAARDEYHSNTLWPAPIAELHDMVCAMARKDQLDPAPFEALLKKKKLSGTVAVMSGDYPSLTPEQLQGLKLARFHKLAVATCMIQPSDAERPTYWIAAVAF